MTYLTLNLVLQQSLALLVCFVNGNISWLEPIIVRNQVKLLYYDTLVSLYMNLRYKRICVFQ